MERHGATGNDGFFGFVLGRSRLVLWAAGAFVLGSAAASSLARVDISVEQLFPVWGEARASYDEYRAAFPSDDVRVSLFWQSEHPPGPVLYRELGTAAALFEAAGLVDVRWMGSARVPTADMRGGEASIGVDLLLDPDSASTDPEFVARALARHRDSPRLRGYLWNRDATVFAVHGSYPFALRDDRARRALERSLTTSLAPLRASAARSAMAGLAVVRSRAPVMMNRDLAVFLGGGLVLAFGMLLYFFRSARLALLCVASVVPGVLGTVGLMSLLGRPINLLTGFIPLVALVVGVCDSVHLVSRVRELGEPRRSAIAAAFGELAVPCLYTSLTTAAGFASLAATRISMIVDFGLFSALAILLTFAFSMTLLPVLLSLAEGGGSRRAGGPRGAMDRVVDASVRQLDRPSWAGVGVFVVVTIVCVAAGTTLEANTYIVHDWRPSSETRRDLAWLEDQGFGLFQVNVFMKGDGTTPLHDPRQLQWMASLSDAFRDEPVVVGAVGPADVVREIREILISDPRGHGSLPESVEEAGQLFLLAELDDPVGLQEVYRPADDVAQLVFLVRDEGSRTLLPLLERLDVYLEHRPPPVGTAVATGIVHMTQSFSARLLQSFGPSLVLGGVLVFLLMASMFRSLGLGLLAVVPNLFPLAILLGVMAAAGLDLKPSTILVFSIAFSLAVDDTIHILGRVKGAMDRGDSVDAALRSTLRTAGPVILVTSTLVAGGFALLMASEFEVLFLIGSLTCVAAIAAVAADLFVFPPVLRRALRKGPLRTARRSVGRGLILAVGAACAGAVSVNAQSDAEVRGRMIAEAAEVRDTGLGDATARLTMVLIDERGGERRWDLEFQMLEGKEDGDRTKLVFQRPLDLRGTTVLTHSHVDREDEQWVYLPALRRVRRIAGAGRGSSFMGSDFAYEDIGSQELEKYAYRHLRDETLEGTPCAVVERRVLDPRSRYGRHVVWFDLDQFRVLRIDYHDRDDRLLKTLWVRGYRPVGSGFWRPSEMEMISHDAGTRTVLAWAEWAVPAGLTERVFDPSDLHRR